ncbi:MAG: hypothetical protein JSW26_16530 [Desulfobacterales bacterium]|nr:MAG: hypothetical protein JSW26_16530 [Desulfobacterales bacterium]
MYSRLRLLNVVVFCLVFVFLSAFCRADDRARDRATLKGIQAVVVRVHSWESGWRAELGKVGMSESILQSSIEQRLENSAIRVVAEEAAKQLASVGVLNVRMAFLEPEPSKKTYQTSTEEKIERPDPRKKYVYAIRLNFRQPVSLLREPSIHSMAITWQTEAVGMRRLLDIREDVYNAVDVFIEAFLSENPR